MKRPTPESLYVLIRDWRGKKGCFPRVAWFAEHLGVSVRTIQRWLRKLAGRVRQILRVGHQSACYEVVRPQVSPRKCHPHIPTALGFSCTTVTVETVEAPRSLRLLRKISEPIVGLFRREEDPLGRDDPDDSDRRRRAKERYRQRSRPEYQREAELEIRRLLEAFQW